MKNLLKKVLSVAAATALLMTSVISASAVDHNHHKGQNTLEGPTDDGYIITLTKPDGYHVADTDAEFGAYQIFTGTVNKTTSSYTNPGNDNTAIPLTDIKWGNAFGDVNSSGWKENIVKFVYALATPPTTGDYASAFTDFHGFDGNNTDTGLKYEKFSGATENTLADRFYTGSPHSLDNVNFDKLAVEVADVIAAHPDREWLQAFTDILGGYGEDYKEGNFITQCYDKNGKWVDNNSDDVTDVYQMKVPAGYYMVLDMTGIDNASDFGESYSARMIFVADNITQVLKEDEPTLDKKIVGADGDSVTTVAGVGDDVEFKLTGTLPSNYDYYTLGYQYTFTDILSAGLTLNEISADTYVNVQVKGVWNDKTKIWDEDTLYDIDVEDVKTDGTHTHDVSYAYDDNYDAATRTLTIKFPCLKEILIDDTYTLGYNPSGTTYKSSQIYVTYTAKVNENAVVNHADVDNDNTKITNLNGNKNTAQLEYSDNPQSYTDKDETTKEEATVYVFGLNIDKVDAAKFIDTNSTEAAGLADAKFALVKPSKDPTTASTTWFIAKFKFVEAPTTPENLPASFKSGYYTINSWERITGAEGETFDPTWIETGYSSYKGNTDSDGTFYNITSLEKGALNISGLDVGVTYTIVETETPNDDLYAKIVPFTVTLTADKTGTEYNGKLDSATVDHTVDDGKSFSINQFTQLIEPKDGVVDADVSAKIIVANFLYENLPSTGGIGVYIYYIAGGCVVALALVLFALSKKKKTTK